MAHDVFISYSAHDGDKRIADAVCAELEKRQIRCWIAPRDVLPGSHFGEAIIDAISESRLFILVFSNSSNSSPQVLREVERAVSKGIPIIPFRIEDVTPNKDMEYFLSTTHWLDALTPPLKRHLKRLADTAQMLLAAEPAGSGPIQSRPVKALLLYGLVKNVFQGIRGFLLRPNRMTTVGLAGLLLLAILALVVLNRNSPVKEPSRNKKTKNVQQSSRDEKLKNVQSLEEIRPELSQDGLWEIRQLTRNGYIDDNPQVDAGHVVWHASQGFRDQVYVYDTKNGISERIADNPKTPTESNTSVDNRPQIDGRYIVWAGSDGSDTEIFLYDLGRKVTTQLTDDNDSERAPVIDGNRVAWYRHPEGIFLYDIQERSIKKIVSEKIPNLYRLQIDGDWILWSGDLGIALRNVLTGETVPLSASGGWLLGARQIKGNKVVCAGTSKTSNYEIFLYDIKTGTLDRITNNNYRDEFPYTDGQRVVWQGGVRHPAAGSDDEIFLYNISTQTTTQITDNDYDDFNPVIENDRIVWFAAYNVFIYDIVKKSTSKLTRDDGSYRDYSEPGMADGTVVYAGGRGDIDQEVFLAIPSDTASKKQ